LVMVPPTVLSRISLQKSSDRPVRTESNISVESSRSTKLYE
jgi:hypothetical protein